MAQTKKRTMTSSQLRRIEDSLRTRQDFLAGERDRRLSEMSLGGESVSIDPIDAASDSLDCDIAVNAVEREAKELVSIREALDRIADGSYGICADCGEEINPKRLEALPFAILCIECKKKAEALGMAESDYASAGYLDEDIDRA